MGRKKERYEVLFEKIQSSVKVVLEGHSMLNRQIGVLHREVAAVKEELGHVEQAVIENNRHLELLVKRFEGHSHAN